MGLVSRLMPQLNIFFLSPAAANIPWRGIIAYNHPDNDSLVHKIL